MKIHPPRIARTRFAAALPPGDAEGGRGRFRACEGDRGRSGGGHTGARRALRLVEFAVVLEPEEPLANARRAFYAGMVALRDALSRMRRRSGPITFVWPDAIQVDGGLIGGGRLAWPAEAAETEPPEWLVFGASVRTVAMGEREAACVRWRLRSRKKASMTSDPVGWSKVSRATSWSPSMPGRPMVRHGERNMSITSSSRRAPWPRSTNGDLLVRWRGQKEPDRHGLAAALVCRHGSIRTREGRAREASAHHPARSIGYFHIRAGGRAGRMGGPGRVRVRANRSGGSRRQDASGVSLGVLGIGSLGWSTLVQVVDASEEDRTAAVELLAQRLVEHFGAPDLAAARPAAEEEVAFASSLSNHPRGMLAAVSRKYEDGAIREAFRTLTPGVGLKPARAYAFLEVVGEEDETGGAR